MGPQVWADYGQLVLHALLLGTAILILARVLRAALYLWWR